MSHPEPPTTVPTTVPPGAPPPRPAPWKERPASFLFALLSPRLRRRPPPDPPPELAPSVPFRIARRHGPGTLAATWYPAGEPRGAVLLAHPWTPWGQAYFHRRGRIEALRQAGYDVMTFDFGGVAASDPRTPWLYDRDLDDAVAAFKARAAHRPLHFWGVSFGGYWGHLMLGRQPLLQGAMFEDVAFHLIEWSKRMAPWGWPGYLVFQHVLAASYRYLDLRRHAPALPQRAVAYVSGADDPAVTPAETRQLAALARAQSLVVPGAGHLEAIRVANEAVIAQALETFDRAIP